MHETPRARREENKRKLEFLREIEGRGAEIAKKMRGKIRNVKKLSKEERDIAFII